MQHVRCVCMICSTDESECMQRASMAPPGSRGQEFQQGGRTGRGAGRKSVVIGEADKVDSDNSEEKAS
ncbi:hypothetical protein JCGZ_09780 [Jatropha curcas]|uniref:Uncharacterized protein n=1 Tax=Jatropha curcas TaxID=180498 RepID=A0A067KVR7_JATCU|nr:hypothetical protein JCGZ_09780 [Jatropha curcas]